MSKIRLSEPIFRSIQGEGDRTGVLSIWVRFFGCNLKCNGFMQAHPTKPETHILPYQTIDVSKIVRVEDLPVLEYGCDSGYSWAPKFKKFAIDYPTASDLVLDVKKFLYDGFWNHPLTHNEIDLCFTGGEPMMQQPAIMQIESSLGYSRPEVIQIETNGTKPIMPAFANFAHNLYCNERGLHFNISPKLYNVSGEENAVNHQVIADYFNASKGKGCLKFVVNNNEETWHELNDHVHILRDGYGVEAPIFVMPVGATAEQQKDSAVLADIANKAIDNGYHVSGRLHAIMFGNGVGT